MPAVIAPQFDGDIILDIHWFPLYQLNAFIVAFYPDLNHISRRTTRPFHFATATAFNSVHINLPYLNINVTDMPRMKETTAINAIQKNVCGFSLLPDSIVIHGFGSSISLLSVAGLAGSYPNCKPK